jgi:hypothetical protein
MQFSMQFQIQESVFMFSKKPILPLVFVLTAQFAWASSDFSCSPTWSLNQGDYNQCSNVPMLSPGNDTRVNLKLLLVDNGFATLQLKPAGKSDTEYGYGKVPFSLEAFDSSIFVAKDKPDNPNDEGRSAGYGGATRCISNDAGKTDFVDALEQSKDLLASERKLLTEERQKLTPTCADASDSSASKKIGVSNRKSKKSTAYKEFMQYITAAAAFYEGHYGNAESIFTKLVDSNQPWLKETSCYMLGRTELNLSQQGAFDADGFPTRNKADQKALLSAEEKFNTYLNEYPDGRYSSSARGLLRRVYWLSNQQQKLADEYEWQLNNPDSPQHNLSLDDLVQEADQKLLFTADPKQIKNPLLLATLDLSLMRTTGPSDTKQISFSDLQKQQPLFANHKALYEYLLAAHRFYVQKDAASALKGLSETLPSKMTYVDFSRLTLRGLALEAAKDQPGARKIWLGLLPIARQPLQAETLQLALALNYEYSNELASVFKPNSPITETEIRSILLQNDASQELLRQVIKTKSNSSQERHIAIYTLLYKDLLQGHYQDYVQDHRFLPKDAAKYTRSSDMDTSDKPNLALFTWSGKKTNDGYGCPSVLGIAKILAKDAEDPYGLVCLGDFVNSNDLEPGYALRTHPTQQSSDAGSAILGSAPSQFSGEAFSRGEAYTTIIEDENVSPDLKAYALYRAIKCYETSGYNHCGGEVVEKSVRKSWFQTLKRRYANSVWAKTLKYYW